MRTLPPLLLLLAGCPAPEPPSCGDGVLDELREACDDGEANGDAPDACRADCSLPTCGDGIVDSGEDCDDGNTWGGDGCAPGCLAEDGAAETEPNDAPAQATPLEGPGSGALPEGDVDCWSVEVPERGYVAADVSGPGGCPDAPVVLSLHAPDGALVARGTPDAVLGCSPLDPILAPGARFLQAGTHAVCVRGFLDQVVPAYTLDVEVGDSCGLPDLPWRPEDDPDGDGAPDACDDDDDDDGLLDAEDNCPRVPNSGEVVPLSPTDDGWLRDWLVVGPLTGIGSDDRCLPTGDRLDPTDAEAVPRLAEPVEDRAWTLSRSTVDRFGLGYLGGQAPRESYQALWVDGGAEGREVTLALGPDDGLRAWLNGQVVLEDPRCQGTRIDQNEVGVTLQPGWNQLLVKVYDQGGGWGLYARFKDGDGPISDLDLSLQDGGPWRPDQTDTDGDGLGDVCDDTPAG